MELITNSVGMELAILGLVLIGAWFKVLVSIVSKAQKDGTTFTEVFSKFWNDEAFIFAAVFAVIAYGASKLALFMPVGFTISPDTLVSAFAFGLLSDWIGHEAIKIFETMGINEVNGKKIINRND